jgi:hypothetical protein
MLAKPVTVLPLTSGSPLDSLALQGARSQTVSESASRASLYLFSVSSTLVALGFIGQISEVGDTFNVFALTVLPTLYVLGLFTFVRLVQSVAEDFQYGRAINRIRHHYLELAGDQAHLFMMSAHDHAIGVLTNLGIKHSTWQAYFTTPSMVAVINSVVGGSAVERGRGDSRPAARSCGWDRRFGRGHFDSGDAPLRDPLPAGRGRRTRDSLSDP